MTVAKRTTLSPPVTIGTVREKATHGAKAPPHSWWRRMACDYESGRALGVVSSRIVSAICLSSV